jgi:hypothetical protein
LFASTATATTIGVFLLCAVVINKSLKSSASIGPSLVLCLIHCRSPTPSVFYFALQSWSSPWRSSSSRESIRLPSNIASLHWKSVYIHTCIWYHA